MELLFVVILLICALDFSHRIHAQTYDYRPCAKKTFGPGYSVCVCNSTYCDTIEKYSKLPKGQYTVYTSTKIGLRLNKRDGQFSKQPWSKDMITFNKTSTRQSIIGFGGAFTDAAGINILSLSVGSQNNLLSSYFSPNGIEYTVGRIPMASCDFSTHLYSYDDSPGDFSLKNFSLAPEDLKYKIPLIQRALGMSHRNLSLYGSPWSAPYWMKTNHNMTGSGQLIGEAGGKYHKTWAQYFVRFVQEYAKHKLHLWGLTAQNEPSTGELPHYAFQTMGWTATQQRDFIASDLGPALKDSGLSHLKLMILDDQRLFLPFWAKTVYSNSTARSFVSGVGVHWYWDFIASTWDLDETHKLYPDKFILATEACTGAMSWEGKSVSLGDWSRGEKYAHSIIQDLNHWVAGWTDWNIALDEEGGPNWVSNFVDSPIIVNKSNDEFYKQPMFYAMGHFSKFIKPDARQVALSGQIGEIEAVGMVNRDNSRVTVLSNKGRRANITLHDPDVGYMNIEVPENSIQTFIWWAT